MHLCTSFIGVNYLCSLRKQRSSSSEPAKSSARAQRRGRFSASIICAWARSRTQESCSLAASKVWRSVNVGRFSVNICFVCSVNIPDLKTISKFAQMEYKLGDPERGKTIFEGIVDSHPKRFDLWSVYMDMEAGQQDIENLRLVS